jgi:uncharacterized protein (TIGR02722 family)
MKHLACLMLVMGCTPAFRGEYSDPMKAEMLDDKWNPKDATMTSEALIGSMLKKPWLGNYKREHKGAKPMVMVDSVENRTDEHLDTEALTEAVRNELINSGVIRFVNTKGREKIVQEIRYQSQGGMVSAETAKQAGKQIGADFFLSGAISSQVNSQSGRKSITYQINLILTNLETAEIVWSEKHRVSKSFERSGSGL